MKISFHSMNVIRATILCSAGFIFCFLLNSCKEEKSKSEKTTQEPVGISKPDSLYGPLFEAVQMQQIFPDGKTFVDCTPKRAPADIMHDYAIQQGPGFDLKTFVEENFDLPEKPATVEVKAEKDIRKHIEELWPKLTRQPGAVKEGSSLLPLPKPYIVPGGRFREIYYWDSYFTMLGLRVSGQTEMMENMVENFAHLIRTYGHIPNGSRSYYLSRSQPPFFCMMVQLLAETKKDEKLYDNYLDAIETEYLYWMDGDKMVKPGEALKKVVRLEDGTLMNRYSDAATTPRAESYRQDATAASRRVDHQLASMIFTSHVASDSFAQSEKAMVYHNLRSAAESGWDFSSRWFGADNNLESIETTNLLPVDLNCLLYNIENVLAKQYERRGNATKAADYAKWAKDRAAGILRYCFDSAAGYFTDYHWVNKEPTGKITAAGLFPLCFLDTSLLKGKIASIVAVTNRELLEPGGLVTTPIESGEQWDAPNGWAPLQWMGIWGLERCGQSSLAATIAKRWIVLNKDVYARTGKMMEKYNVRDIGLEAGGGEYPGQDGFGWTNGVLLALMEKYK